MSSLGTAATDFAETAGDPAAPGIVLVHGTRMAGAYWHGEVAALGDRFHTIAVDLPGHGKARGTRFTHEGAMKVMLDAVEACAGGVAIVVGHSLGGYLAMDLAAHAPERCRALVLVGCTAVARGPRTWPYRLAMALVPLLPERLLTRLNDWLLRRRYPAAIVGPQIAAGYGFAAIPASWRAVLGRDHARALARFPGPVLFVNGERDWFRAGEDHFRRCCPTAELAAIPKASHLCNWDQPETFLAVVRSFAVRVSNEASS